jgi:ribosomal protein L10
LVSRYLVALGLDVQHIHADGKLESHADALSRLAQMLNLPEDDMFRSREDLIADAYRLQENRIAYASDVPVIGPSSESAER